MMQRHKKRKAFILPRIETGHGSVCALFYQRQASKYEFKDLDGSKELNSCNFNKKVRRQINETNNGQLNSFAQWQAAESLLLPYRLRRHLVSYGGRKTLFICLRKL
jgi:hypothetical protein